METSNEILELKFDGNNVSPSTVKPSEIAKLIIDFEKALLSTISASHPEINTDALLFSFVEVDDKSLDLKFIPLIGAAKDVVIAAYLSIAVSIKDNNFKKLSVNTIIALKDITKFSKKYKCSGYLNHNYVNVATFTHDTEINLEKASVITGETTIYGKVIDVGGENPNVHFKINNDYTVIIDVKEEIAKQLAPKLFEEVGLKGTAKWDAISYQVTEFKIIDIIEYEPKTLKKTFNDLRNSLGKYWDGVDDVSTYLS